jgi:hypothetical protein
VLQRFIAAVLLFGVILRPETYVLPTVLEVQSCSKGAHCVTGPARRRYPVMCRNSWTWSNLDAFTADRSALTQRIDASLSRCVVGAAGLAGTTETCIGELLGLRLIGGSHRAEPSSTEE